MEVTEVTRVTLSQHICLILICSVTLVTSVTFTVGSEMKLSLEYRRILRRVVKLAHMQHYPKEFCTDYEADKMIDVIAPQTIENLIRVGKETRIDHV